MKMSVFTIYWLFLSCLTAFSVSGAAANSAAESEAQPWFASANYSYSEVSDGRAPWHRTSLIAGRRGQTGALLAEALQVTRFGSGGEALAMSVYRELWARSYANVRLQYAPEGDVLPGFDGSVELFQGFPSGLEFSAAYQARAYPEQRVHLGTLGVGAYIGSWYLRSRTTLFSLAGEVGVVEAAYFRRYWKAPSDYFEIQGGLGRGVELIGAGSLVDVTRTAFVGARVQRYLTNHLGASITLSYSDDDFFERLTVGTALLVRW